MKRLEINLAGDLILSARKRCLIYRTMLVYLFLTGLALIFFCGKASSDFKKALEYQHEIRVIQQQFQRLHPGAGPMEQYADQLRAQIDGCAQQARTIREALPPGLYTVLPMLNTILNQTDQTVLYRLTFVQESGSRPGLEFSTAVPTQGRKSLASSFLQNWQKNPELAKLFASITPITTVLGKSGNEDVFITNYKAVFKE